MDNPTNLTHCKKLKSTDAKFSIDFHRCGKCLIEYESLEDFICHKIAVDKCSLVLWESKKLIGFGLQIPSFLEFADGNRSPVAGNSLAEPNDRRSSVKDMKKNGRDRPRKTEEKVILKRIEDLPTSKSEPWKCCLCRLTFRNLNSLKYHRDAEHKHKNAVSQARKTYCGSKNMRKLENNLTSTDLHNRLVITEYIPVDNIPEDALDNESTCPKCGNKYKDPIVLKTHLNTVHCESRPYKCKYDCSLSFKTKGSLMRHIRRHTGERPYICKKCGRSFRESGALTRHLKSRFPCSTKTDNDLARYGKTVGLDKCDAVIAESGSTLPNTVSAIKAIITDISEKSKGSFDPHLSHSASPSIDCDLIVNNIVEETNEISEQNPVHSLEKTGQSFGSCLKFGKSKGSQVDVDTDEDELSMNLPISKDICNSENRETMLEVFQEPSSKLSEDFLIEDKDLKCLSCMQHFQNKLDFKSHLMFHLEGLPYRCIQCCFVCQSKQHLVKHQRKKHGVLTDNTLKKNTEECEASQPDIIELDGDDDHIQDIVKLLFRTQNSIEADELEFSGLIKKPAKHSSRCHICLKRFSGSLYLGFHMGIHTGEKPYVCDVCKKSFFLKDSLKKHTICHSEERRYRCGECYKSFKRLSHVKDHLRIHSQLCPYQCNKCGKAFRWQGTLKSHELSHGGPALRLHLCSTCGRRFPSKWSLARHQHLHSSETASAAQQLTFQGTSDSSCHEVRTNKALKCLPETKIMCISEDELVLRKHDGISIEDQDSSVSGAGAETYVLIAQEDGSSCLVPTAAIVEELQEGTAVINNIEGDCS